MLSWRQSHTSKIYFIKSYCKPINKTWVEPKFIDPEPSLTFIFKPWPSRALLKCLRDLSRPLSLFSSSPKPDSKLDPRLGPSLLSFGMQGMGPWFFYQFNTLKGNFHNPPFTELILCQFTFIIYLLDSIAVFDFAKYHQCIIFRDKTCWKVMFATNQLN